MADRDRRDEPNADKPASGLPTLYAAPLGDARDRAAIPREAPRGRSVLRAQKTSDVTRFRGIFPATLVAAATAAAAALLVPPPGGHAAPGPLSRPHANAKLGCEKCHGQEKPGQEKSGQEKPGQEKRGDDACVNCHGPHAPHRKGHEKLFQAGVMRCATCHKIHFGDQGVAFVPGQSPIRFAPGVERVVEDANVKQLNAATVAIVSVASCKGCHDLTSSRDPINRCLIPGQEKLGFDRPSVCFDEHQTAFPVDDARRPAPSPSKGRVCAAQHGEDRAVAWDNARQVASIMPVLGRSEVGDLSWLWLGAGTAAFGLTFSLVRGVRWFGERRKAKKDKPASAALVKPQTRVRLPQIDTQTCLGCYACVDACPYDVLEIQRYVAVVVRPEACCGLTLCEQRCPNGSLVITDGEAIGDRPRIKENLESKDTAGLFLAGDVTGLPLIKNAIVQGSHAIDEVHKSLNAEGSVVLRGDKPLDLVIIGAGPAGISAALRAKELGLSFAVLEQGDVAQSIRSFPRGKLVFDQPLDLPLTGKLWLKESTKEELLSHWMRIVRKEALPIREGRRMTSIEKDPATSLFRVASEPREGGAQESLQSRRVLLTIGQRGTPRRLPFSLSASVEAHVFYSLADARSFEGKRVIVVGLGDVAMETALALGRQPGTTVTVVHRGKTFSRGKSRNIDEVKRMSAASRLRLCFDAEIDGIDDDAVTIRSGGRSERIGYDAVFVMIGSIPPWSTLEAAGVQREGA